MNKNSTRSYQANAPKAATGLVFKFFLLVQLLLAISFQKGYAQAEYASTQSVRIDGPCSGCGVSNAQDAVDNNLDNYATFVTDINQAGNVVLTLDFSGLNPFPGRDSIIIRVGANNPTMAAHLFQGVMLETINGANGNADGINISPANVRLLPDGTGAELIIKPGMPFTGVKFTLISSMMGVVDGLRVYHARRKPGPGPDANGILYVKKGSAGDGSSWASPLGELGDALKLAREVAGVKEIWVAGGTYYPMYELDNPNVPVTNARFRSFALRNNIKLYGGFAGAENSPDERDLGNPANKTILSGDLENNDPASGFSIGNNSLHVMVVTPGTYTVDGFTFYRGSADIPGYSHIVEGVTISGGYGAGIFVAGASLEINNCVLKANWATHGGAIYSNASSSITVSNTLISGNYAAYGAGLYANSSSAIIINSTIASNASNYGAINNAGSFIKVYNSIIYGNMTQLVGDPCVVNNSIVQGGYAGAGNLSANPVFRNDPGYTNNPNPDGDFTLGAGSAAINAGNNARTVATAGENIDPDQLADNLTGSSCSGLLCSVVNPGYATTHDSYTDYGLLNIPVGLIGVLGTAQLTVGWDTRSIQQGDFVGFIISQYNLPLDYAFLQNIKVTLFDNLGIEVSNTNGFSSYQTGKLDGQDVIYIGMVAPANIASAQIELTQQPGLLTSLRVHAAFIMPAGLKTTITKDLVGNPRINNQANGGIVDMGAYETQKLPQTIAVSDVMKVYGDADFAPGFTASSGLTVSYTSASNDIAEPYQDAADNNTWKIKIKKAGDVVITASQAGDDTYEAAPAATFDLSIGKKAVVISVRSTASITKVYDGTSIGHIAASDLTFDGGDIINGDDVVPTLNTTGINYNNKNAGTGKTIIFPADNLGLSGDDAGNYVIGNSGQFVYNDAAITPSPLTVTAQATNKVYGDDDPVFLFSVSPAVFTGDAVTGALARETGEDAGTYDMELGSVSAGPNYLLTLTTAQLTIGPKPVTVSFKSNTVVSKIYDGNTDGSISVSDLEFTGGAIINGDDAGIGLGATAVAYDDQHVGANKTITLELSYISITGAKAGNYELANTADLTFNGAVITVATLNITANAHTKVYGENDPAFTFSANGLTGNDAIGGSLSRHAGENAGNYAITIGTLDAGLNYSINFTGASFTITKAPQTITWNQSNLEAGCNGISGIQLLATSNSGLPVGYTVANTNIATVTGDMLMPVSGGATTITAVQAGDQNHEAASAVVKDVKVNIAGAIRQLFSDVLAFDNSSGDYVQWQWYKNGNLIPGATQGYYNETPALNGSYHVVVTNRNGIAVEACPLAAAGSTTARGIKVNPNPARPGSTVTVTCNYNASALTGARLLLTTATGSQVQQVTNVQPVTQLILPATSGLYVITLVLSNGEKTSVNVLSK